MTGERCCQPFPTWNAAGLRHGSTKAKMNFQNTSITKERSTRAALKQIETHSVPDRLVVCPRARSNNSIFGKPFSIPIGLLPLSDECATSSISGIWSHEQLRPITCTNVQRCWSVAPSYMRPSFRRMRDRGVMHGKYIHISGTEANQ